MNYIVALCSFKLFMLFSVLYISPPPTPSGSVWAVVLVKKCGLSVWECESLYFLDRGQSVS